MAALRRFRPSCRPSTDLLAGRGGFLPARRLPLVLLLGAAAVRAAQIAEADTGAGSCASEARRCTPADDAGDSLQLIQQAAAQVLARARLRGPEPPPPPPPAAADAAAQAREAPRPQAVAHFRASTWHRTLELPAPLPAAAGDSVARAPVALEPQVTTTTTTVDPLGLTLNAEGDLDAFLYSLATNIAMAIFCVGLFCVLRVRYPLMYSYNVMTGAAPSTPDKAALFSWVGAALSADRHDWVNSVGLDNAMLLEFTHLSMRVMAAVGLPTTLVLAPMHLCFGGHAAGTDRMSYLSFGNVALGNWLYWVHPFIVWAVCITVKHFVFSAQSDFVHMRFEWLKHMAVIRANSVLVGGISKKYQSDQALKEFFEKIFPGENRILKAYCVKDTRQLPSLVAQWRTCKQHLDKAEHERGESGAPQMVRSSIVGERVEATAYYTEKLTSLWTRIKEHRQQILDATATPDDNGNTCTNGFVTFTNRADAEVALRLDTISKDQEKWDIQHPPEPNDVLWADLSQDSTLEKGWTLMGYALIMGLYVAYMPAVIGLTHIAEAVNLGPLQPFWAGLAPTFGLTVMVSFLPTFIIIIFRWFFTLKADAWAQHRLQNYYFWFQVVFVLLATAVGRHFTQFLIAVSKSPLAIFHFLGSTLPFATHFYMNYMVLQWSTHCMNILRYVNLFKFKALLALYNPKEAAAMAEPEDQDYYGLGSRSARWTINLLIGIVFGTLCPPMYLLTFLNFLICRVVYGYLIPFAETRKPDLGGYFWVASLRHIFIGLAIYVILMTGVLYERARNNIPSWITVSSLIYVFWAKHRFETHFAWEKLPFKYVVGGRDEEKEKRQIEGEYQQPELFADYEEIKAYMLGKGLEAAS